MKNDDQLRLKTLELKMNYIEYAVKTIEKELELIFSFVRENRNNIEDKS